MKKNIINRLSKNQVKDLRFLGSMISKGEPAETIETAWEKILTSEWSKIKGLAKDVPLDINALVQYVLRESYVESSDDLSFHAKKVKYFNQQKKKIRDHINEIRAEMEKYINLMEEQLSSIGDDAQLANIDLQNMLQKQQQTIQMLSNVSKVLHDTGLAVIRKIR